MSNTKVRYPAVEQFIDNNKDALVRSVQEIVRFPSVEAPRQVPEHPSERRFAARLKMH